MAEPIFFPDIEENIPFPREVLDPACELSPTEEMAMRVRTIKLLADLSGNPIVPSEKNIQQAKDLARQMIEDPRARPEYAKYPNETLAFLAGMVARMNVQIVDDLVELKTYVTNKLVNEVETATSSKDRIAALKLLGEVDGVDAYKKRAETTHIIKPIQEVEQELAKLIDGVTYEVLEDTKEKVNG